MNKSELVHEGLCVCGQVHVDVSFHRSGTSDRSTCGNVFGGGGGGGSLGGGDLVSSRSRFLVSLKNGSHLDYFSLTAAKLSDSNLATRFQSGNHMCTPAPASFNVEL